MLVLSRRIREKIVFPTFQGVVQVLDIKRGVVRLGIEAPPEVPVFRQEVHDRMAEWSTPSKPVNVEPKASAVDRSNELLDGQLRDAGRLLGVARLQLQVGLNEGAVAALDDARQRLEAMRRTLAAGRPERRSPLPGRRKALLVEDNANERELLALFLRQAGLDVDTANDGVDALEYLHHREAPNVVLLDMGLPRCDGATAVREIRRDPRTADLKVFAVSGSRPDAFAGPGGPPNVNGWFHKPIDPEALVNRIIHELEECPV